MDAILLAGLVADDIIVDHELDTINVVNCRSVIRASSLPVIWFFPVIWNRVDFAANVEDGEYELQLLLRIGPKVIHKFDVEIINRDIVTESDGCDSTLNVNQIQFDEFGKYAIEVQIAGHYLGSIPIWIIEDKNNKHTVVNGVTTIGQSNKAEWFDKGLKESKVPDIHNLNS